MGGERHHDVRFGSWRWGENFGSLTGFVHGEGIGSWKTETDHRELRVSGLVDLVGYIVGPTLRPTVNVLIGYNRLITVV